jgi:hypothetical protein
LVRSYGTDGEREVRQRPPLKGRADARGAHHRGGKNDVDGFNLGGFDGAPVTGLGQEAAGRSIGGSGVLHLEEETR